MSPEEFFGKLESMGWLTEVSDAKRASLLMDLRKWHERNPAWTYLGLSTGGYDTEMIEDDDSYLSLVKAYRKASGGSFDPVDVESTADYDEETATVSFTLGGRPFRLELPFEDDYVHEDFEPFVNSALEACGIGKRFFTLPAIDQAAGLVFVSPRLYEAARQSGLVPVDSDDEMLDREDGG